MKDDSLDGREVTSLSKEPSVVAISSREFLQELGAHPLMKRKY